MENKKKRIKIKWNAMSTLVFAVLCFAALLLNMLTKGSTNRLLFSVYRSSFANPLAYVRVFTHVLGHADWSHLIGNMMYILLLGPILEERYGSLNILFVMMCTALVTGVINLVFFPHVSLLGASGVVFAMILLLAMTPSEKKTIPITFILVVLLYIGQEVYTAVTVADNVSHMAHIIGGLVGGFLGFLMNKWKMNRF